jgi:hypothetical protein
MEKSTGKLDKLIEEKVDEKIRKFSTLITDQIRTFLQENGDFRGDYLYQAQNFKNSHCGKYNEPIDYNHRNLSDLYRNLKGGLELTIKDKMIDKETKDLLNKVSLLT